MKKISFLLSVFFLIQIFTFKLYAQEHYEDVKSYKNNVTFNLMRLVFNELRFGYERNLAERHIIRAVLGLQYPTSSESFNSFSVGLGEVPQYWKVSKGVYIGAGYSFILGTQSNSYISAEVFYCYNYYDNKYYNYCVGMDMDSYVSLQSMQLRKSGVKILFGRKVRLVSGTKVGLELDFFAGFGFLFRNDETTIYGQKYGGCYYDHSELYAQNPPKIEIDHNLFPTLNAGILICMPF